MKTLRSALSVALLPLLIQCAQEAPKSSSSVRRGPGGATADGTATGGTGSGKGTGGTQPVTPVTPSAPGSDAAIPSGPTTPAVAVANGTVTFDLAAAKAALPGASLSVTMAASPQVGTVPASVTLSAFAIKSPANTGFVLYRPVLVAVAPDGSEKQFPIGTNITQRIPKGRVVPLSNLLRVPFEGVTDQHKLKFRFSALEPLEPAILDGLSNYRECKAPQSFTAVASGLQSCKACHGGLFAYEFMDKDMATACGQNLKIIDLSLNPSGRLPAIPGGAHQGTNAGAASTAIQSWRQAEGL